MVALTFDIEGLPLSTAVIAAESLVDAVDAVGQKIMASLTYERGLSLFVAAFLGGEVQFVNAACLERGGRA
jgi:hypothetical protein